MNLDMASLECVMRDVWTLDLTGGIEIRLDTSDPERPPVMVLRRVPEWNGWLRRESPPLRVPADFSDWFFGPLQFFRSLDRQIKDAVVRFGGSA